MSVCCFTSLYAYCDLPSSTATYSIYSRKSHVGKVLETITHHKRHYSIKNSTKIGFFLLRDTIQQSSKGLFLKNTIQPTEYELSDLDKKTNNFINFYPNQNRVRANFKSKISKSTQKNWPIYDPLSYQLALRCKLMTTEFSTLTLPVFDQDHLHKYRFKVISRNKIIDTAIGKLNTIEVKLLVLPENVIALLWFARHRHMILVQSSLLTLNKGSVFSAIKSLK
ncbi:MAG: DUF3108 domain-containing protein [Coxiellaceae bacterium]|nr:DUF3108 domain-containing protein [Coxiellaceae bacterium]